MLIKAIVKYAHEVFNLSPETARIIVDDHKMLKLLIDTKQTAGEQTSRVEKYHRKFGSFHIF